MTLVEVYKSFCKRKYSQWTDAMAKLPSFVKTKLDRSSTDVVEVASFVGNPVFGFYNLAFLPHHYFMIKLYFKQYISGLK